MKLLIITQIVDRQDSNLGFFQPWLAQLAGRVEQLTVLCLKKGEYHLPANVRVLSLGKENSARRWQYLKNFYRFIWQYRQEYDHVFVHMNPEYVILGGLIWRMWEKKVLLWYVHKAVNLRLRLATLLATKIFTASKESFRLPSGKVEIVGHGIDVSTYELRTSTNIPARLRLRANSLAGGRTTNILPVRLLWAGRISLVKDLETVILAFQELMERHQDQEIWLDIVGDAITVQDEEYRQTLLDLAVKLNISHRVQFLGGVFHDKMPEVYAAHHALIHPSRTGSIDKVVLEALASGLTVLTSSAAYDKFGDLVLHFPPNKAKELAWMIERRLLSGVPEVNYAGREYVECHHNLNNVIGKIINYFQTNL